MPKTLKNGIPPAEALNEIRAVVTRAKQGDTTAVPKLRELLDAHPDLWRHFGNLAVHAELSWVNLVAGPDLYLKECLIRHAAAMREELSGPSPIEKLLVERVVACFLQLQYFDAAEAQENADDVTKLSKYRLKRQAQAHRNYISALSALATIRKLLPGPMAAPEPATATSCPMKQARSNNGKAFRESFEADSKNRIAEFFGDDGSIGIVKRVQQK